jgi:tetratricopeptide (TPR) repeat protein
MKKLTFLFLLLTGIAYSQVKSIDSIKYNYIGYAIDSTIYNGEKEYINNLFDVKSFANSFLLKSKDKEILEFNKEFMSGFMKGFDYGGIMVREIGEEGSYDFFKSYVDENQQYHLVFRLFSEAGLNYHDYELKKIRGSIKIVDVYIYVTGENFSTTVGTLYKTAIASNKKNFFGFTTNAFLKDITKLNKIRELKSQGKLEEAYTFYKEVSSESKKNKMFQLVGITLASSLNDNELLSKLTKNYEESFPNDPSLYLISVDGAFVNNKFDRVLELINNLEAAIGGDDFLNYIRVNAYYAKGDILKAIEYSELLMSDFPNYMDGFDTALTLYIEAEKFDKAIQILDIFVDRFELTKDSLIESMKENFPNFSKNKKFLDWVKAK